MSALRAATDNVRAELAANPKLRLGVWSIVAILLGYWVLVPHAARVEKAAADYAAMDARLVRGRVLLARDDWQQWLDEARTTEAALAERIWHADNPGLAQAQVRTAIEEMARPLRLEPRVDVGLSRSVPGVPGLWQVDVQLSSRSSLEATLRFVDAVSRHPRMLVVERLTLTRRNPQRRREEFNLEGLLYAYFRLGGPGDSQAADPAAALPTRQGQTVADGLVPSRLGATAASRPGRPQGSPAKTPMGETNA